MTDTQPSTEVQVLTKFDNDTLRGISSWDHALTLVAEENQGEVYSSADLGNGFEILDEKDRLIGVPLIFIQWQSYKGDFGDFVSAYVMARFSKDGNSAGKFVLNDGGTGIAQQLMDFTERTERNSGLVANHGLRKSTYDNPYEPGTKAHTFYIDTTP